MKARIKFTGSVCIYYWAYCENIWTWRVSSYTGSGRFYNLKTIIRQIKEEFEPVGDAVFVVELEDGTEIPLLFFL